MFKRIIIAAGALLLLAVGLKSTVYNTGCYYTKSENITGPSEEYRMEEPTDGSKHARINLNTATKGQIKNCPYAGKYAEEIVALRESLGGYVSLEQLALIHGIGSGTCEYAAQYFRLD